MEGSSENSPTYEASTLLLSKSSINPVQHVQQPFKPPPPPRRKSGLSLIGGLVVNSRNNSRKTENESSHDESTNDHHQEEIEEKSSSPPGNSIGNIRKMVEDQLQQRSSSSAVPVISHRQNNYMKPTSQGFASTNPMFNPPPSYYAHPPLQHRENKESTISSTKRGLDDVDLDDIPPPPPLLTKPFPPQIPSSLLHTNVLQEPRPLQPRGSDLDLNVVNRMLQSRLPSVSDVDHEQYLTTNDRSLKVITVKSTNTQPRGNPPSYNPHVMHRLSLLSPWPGVESVDSLSMQDVGKLMEKLYVSNDSVKRLMQFRPRRSDVIVCGCVRSGQTAILRIVDYLRGSLATDITSVTAWVENAESLDVEVPRLLKTHMSAQHVLEASNECKIIAVLRDPADLRVSWFRHSRRLFHKMCPKSKVEFDTIFNFEAFSKQPMPKLGEFGGNAEHHIAYGLRAQELRPGNVCLIFYEDLIENPRLVIDKLAHFTGYGITRTDKALEKLTQDVCHPSQGKRVGSTKAGMQMIASNPGLMNDFSSRWEIAMRQSMLKNPGGNYDAVWKRFGALSGVNSHPGSRRGSELPVELFAKKRISQATDSNPPGNSVSSNSSGGNGVVKRRSRSFTSGSAFRTANSTLPSKSSFKNNQPSDLSSKRTLSKLGSFSFLGSSTVLRKTMDTKKKKLIDPDDSDSEEEDDESEDTPGEVVVVDDVQYSKPGNSKTKTNLIVGHKGGGKRQ